MNRRAKSIIWILASAGVVLAVGAILVAGGYANGILRGLAQCALSQQFDEVCRIGEIQGNPLGDCRIVDVQIGDWGRVDTLDVAYNFGSLLIGKVVVHRLRLSGIEVRIHASGEKTEVPWWNVLLPLNIESLEIANANVVIDSTQMRDISLKGAFSAEELILERFGSVQFEPPLEVTNLSGIAVLQVDAQAERSAVSHLQLTDLVLNTRKSRVLLSGTVRPLDDNHAVDLNIKADSLWLPDIGNTVPTVDMPECAVSMRGNVSGNVKGGLGSLILDSLVTKLVVDHDTSNVIFNGVLGTAPFALRGDAIFNVKAFDPARWGISLKDMVGLDTDLPYVNTSVEGMITFAVDSSGVEKASASTDSIIFQNVQFGDARFDSVRFDGNLANGLLQARITANGLSGNIEGHGKARLSTWDGEGEMRFRDLVAGHFPGVPQKVGRATGHIDFERKNTWRASIALEELQAMEVQVDSVHAIYIDQRLSVDHFEAYLQNWGTRVNSNGQLHFEAAKPDSIVGNIRAKIELPRLLDTELWGDSLRLTGDVKGILGDDSMRLETPSMNAIWKDIKGGDWTVTLKGNIKGNAAADRFQISALIDSTLITDIRVDLSGEGGVFSARGHFDQYFKTRWYADVNRLAAVGEIVGIDLSGDVELSGALWGPRNSSADSLNFSAQCSADGLEVAGVPIELVGPGDLMLSGALWDADKQNGILNILLSGDLRQLGELKKRWDVPVFYSARGGVDSLAVAGVRIQNADLTMQGTRPDSGTLKIDRMALGEQAVQAVRLHAVSERGKTSFELYSDKEAQNWVVSKGYLNKAEDSWQVAMDPLHIKVDKVALNNEDPVRFSLPSQGVQITNLKLQIKDLKHSKSAGYLKKRDQQTVEVVLEDLRPWASLSGVSDAGGRLDGKISFFTPSTPLPNSLVFELTNGKIKGVEFDNATGKVAFGNGRMHFETQVRDSEDEVLELAGSFPFADTDTIDLRVQSKGLALSKILKASSDIAEGISGVLSLDLKARGRFEQPNIQGKLEIKNGAFSLPYLQRSFAPISLVATTMFDSSNIRVDSLEVGTSAKLWGNVTLEGFKPKDWNLQMELSDFEPVAWPELQLKIGGKLDITGTPQRPEIEGKLSMTQAEIRLAKLLEMPVWETPDFLKALKVDNLKLSADRRVWVRDPTFELEVKGDLDVTTNGKGLHITGIMESRRGNYIFQNRRMRITKSEIRFLNWPQEHPDLDIHAETIVRGVVTQGGQAEPIAIVVTVEGTVAHPQILITSDPPVGEGREDIEDIVALMVTGRSVGQFQFSREGTLYPILGVAANRLGQYIGQELSLDLVEVDVGEGNVSRVQLSKYIGDNIFGLRLWEPIKDKIFMSYAQDFSRRAYGVIMEFDLVDSLTVENQGIRESMGLSWKKDTENQQKKESVSLFWQKEW